MALSVIIPAYNEAHAIVATVKEIHAALSAAGLAEFEILVVDDGSDDGTADELAKVGTLCRVLRRRANKGYGAAIKFGLRYARCDAICITDADGTYPISEIPALYAEFSERELDMLVGARNGARVVYPLIRRIPKVVIRLLAEYITETKIPDINSGLRIFRKDVALRYFHLYPNGFSLTTTMTVSTLCDDLDVDYRPINYSRRVGVSKIRPVRDTLGFLMLLVRISLYFRPLRFFVPPIILVGILAAGSIVKGIVEANLSESCIILCTALLLLIVHALLADMIIRRTPFR